MRQVPLISYCMMQVTVGCFPPGPGACAGCCSGGFDCGQTCHISWGARTCNSSIDPLRHTPAVYLNIMCTRARSRRTRRPRTCHAGTGSILKPGGRHRPPHANIMLQSATERSFAPAVAIHHYCINLLSYLCERAWCCALTCDSRGCQPPGHSASPDRLLTCSNTCCTAALTHAWRKYA